MENKSPTGEINLNLLTINIRILTKSHKIFFICVSYSKICQQEYFVLGES